MYCAVCDQPMCGGCVHERGTTSVCPTCVRVPQETTAPRRAATKAPIATLVLVLACLAVFIYDQLYGGRAFVAGTGPHQVGPETIEGLGELTFFGPSLEFDGEWYRVFTSAFVHFSALHVGVNVLVIWQLGRLMEGSLGRLTFVVIFVAGVLGGSLGALLVEPDVQVAGASGGGFALMGAMAMVLVFSGKNVLRTSVGLMLTGMMLLSLMPPEQLSFLPPVSLGAHLGGAAVGIVAGLVVSLVRRWGRRARAAAPVLIAGLGYLSFLATVAATGSG